LIQRARAFSRSDRRFRDHRGEELLGRFRDRFDRRRKCFFVSG